MKIAKIPYDDFDNFYKNLNPNPKYDEEFLYAIFENLIDSYNETAIEALHSSEFSNINPYQLFLYLYFEYDFFASKASVEELENAKTNDDLLSAIISVALDKYLTNEKIDLHEKQFISKYSPAISTFLLFNNFMNKIVLNYSKDDPTQTLIFDIFKKCLNISKSSIELLVNGFEEEAFAVWRTLHEAECILYLLINNGKPLVDEYLIHLNYSIVYRKGAGSKEKTDKIFEEIKEKMKKYNLKSKDMKKFIEYGYLLSIDGYELDKDFKLNFRDGIEKLAGLSEYSRLYELSSEIAHSSPLMIYSNEHSLFHLTLINLYEVFFRMEKEFSAKYLQSIGNNLLCQNYLRMRDLYYNQLVSIYNTEKLIYKKLIENN